MAENNIPINDLHAHMTKRLKDFEKKGNVHFDAAGSKYLAEKVAASILEALGSKAKAGSSTFPGKVGKWNGFAIHNFKLDGRNCRLVVPDEPAAGRPWVWRARFFGHEPQADIALLKKGFHVAYIEVGGLYGAPPAVKIWDAFHKYLTTEHKLAAKPALEGMSRGGLIIYNWAAKNPDKVSCIYGDAPVCDIRSWPGKRGRDCLKVYGITAEQLADFKENPIDHLAPLAKAKVPLLIVAGDADKVVPMKENALVMQERYKKLGGQIILISKKGVGHHPHSLKDPAPIVEFILKHTKVKKGASAFVLTSANDPTKPVPGGVRWFGRQHRSYVEQTKNKKFDLCFLGDSIIDMWPRDLFGKYYGKYNVVNFGIGGDRCENVLWRLENGELKGTSPRVIVLLIGTNNSGMNTAREIAYGITAVVKALRAGCPKSKILLLAVFPKKDMPLEKTKAINAIVAKLDDKKMIRYLDIGHGLLDKDNNIKEGVLKDVVHLTRKGYEIWAKAMNPLLAAMMKK